MGAIFSEKHIAITKKLFYYLSERSFTMREF